MRLPMVNCILLAFLATTLATETRSKRDLQFWKDVIAAKLGLTAPKPTERDENVKILRIPGFDQVLVRAVPKVTIVEESIPQRIVQVDPTIAMIGSYLGTKSPEETLFALQGMRHLLQSGVMTARQDFIDIAPPKPPVYILPQQIVQQNICPDCPEPRPVFPVFEKTFVPMSPALRPLPMPMLPPIPVLPPLPARPIPPPPKLIVPEIKPVPLPPIVAMPVVPTRYSYKQVNSDGLITSYLSEGNKDVIITETREPLPPPPSFIIDRLEKIVYGKPLGTPVPVTLPKATFGDLVVGPYYTESLTPIMTEPSDVDVKVNHFKKPQSSKVMNNPFTSPVVQEKIAVSRPITVDIPEIPLAIPPSPVILEKPQSEDSSPLSYKHVHGDGSWSTYSGTESMREPFELVHFEHISELPPPPEELLKRIGYVAGKAHKPKSWGYSLKMSNGVSSYETLDGDKIHYSHLESPSNSDVAVFPDPLSSIDSNEPRNPSKNVVMVGDKDEYGNPFISTRINGELSTEFTGEETNRPELQAMKKMPPLPMPIAGNNQIPTEVEIGKNSEYHSFGSHGFSYTQVNHDGTIGTFTGTGKETKPAIVVQPIKKIPPLPAPIVGEVRHTIKPAKVTQEHTSGFSYTKIDKQGSVTTISGGESVNEPALVHSVETMNPAQPIAIVDVIQPVTKTPCKSNTKCKKNPSRFSYSQINNEGGVTKFTGDGQVIKPTVVEDYTIPVPAAIVDVIQPVTKPPSVVVEVNQKNPSGLVMFANDEGGVTKFTGDGQAIKPTVAEDYTIPVPAAIVDVIQPVTKPPSLVVEVNQKNPSGAVMFDKPMFSSYVYKQISHSNPQPFTVVNVGDEPEIEVPAGDVHVKVNKHEHTRPDGTTYPCTEVHRVVPDAPIPPIPTVEIVRTVPEGFLYVPPLNVDIPTSQEVEVNHHGSHFSYTQVSSGSSTGAPTTTTEAEHSNSDEPTSFNLNPIVVYPEDSKYSYTQKNSDGSSLNVEGNKDNTVSVKLEDGETKNTDSGRGDIPDASV